MAEYVSWSSSRGGEIELEGDEEQWLDEEQGSEWIARVKRPQVGSGAVEQVKR